MSIYLLKQKSNVQFGRFYNTEAENLNRWFPVIEGMFYLSEPKNLEIAFFMLNTGFGALSNDSFNYINYLRYNVRLQLETPTTSETLFNQWYDPSTADDDLNNIKVIEPRSLAQGFHAITAQVNVLSEIGTNFDFSLNSQRVCLAILDTASVQVAVGQHLGGFAVLGQQGTVAMPAGLLRWQ